MFHSVEPSPQISYEDTLSSTAGNTNDSNQMALEVPSGMNSLPEPCVGRDSKIDNVIQLRPEQQVHQSMCQLKESTAKCTQEGNHAESLKIWLAAFENAKEMPPAIQWYILDNLSSTYLDLKQNDQAELYSTLTVELAKELQLDPSYLARSLNTLAGALYHQGRFAEAEPLAVQVLQIYNKTLGRDHADVGTACNNLAMVYHAQSKFELAEMLYQRAVEVRTKILGSDHPSVVTLMTNHSAALVALQVSQQLEKSVHENKSPNEVVSVLSDVLWEKITG